MTIVVTSAAKYSNLVQTDTATTRALLLKLYFEPTSFNTIDISKVYVFYEEPYLEEFTGVITNTNQTRDFVCTTMRDKCSDIWELNGLSTIEECTAKLQALPATEEKADFSGNTQGCRVLHAAFAAENQICRSTFTFDKIVVCSGELPLRTRCNMPRKKNCVG